MRMSVLGACVGGIGLLGVTACEPLELGLHVRREGTIAAVQDGTEVTLQGRVTCSRSEPVDLFLNLAQGTQAMSAERSVPCEEGESTRLRSYPFLVRQGTPTPGNGFVRLRACTNTDFPWNQDCVTVERIVTFTTPTPTKTTVPPASGHVEIGTATSIYDPSP